MRTISYTKKNKYTLKLIQQSYNVLYQKMISENCKDFVDKKSRKPDAVIPFARSNTHSRKVYIKMLDHTIRTFQGIIPFNEYF